MVGYLIMKVSELQNWDKNPRELDPKYCQVITDRWEKLTEQKAIKL